MDMTVYQSRKNQQAGSVHCVTGWINRFPDRTHPYDFPSPNLYIALKTAFGPYNHPMDNI